MEAEWTHSSPEVHRAKRRSRVQSACQRCRRQKLKCDQERPCSLCVRSEVPCVSEFRERRRKLGSRQSISNGSGSLQHDETGLPASLPAASVSPRSQPAKIVVDEDHSMYTDGEPSNATARQKAVSVDQFAASDPQYLDQRISSAGLTQAIIDNFSPETVLDTSTSALPGGVGRSEDAPRPGRDTVTVEELFGFELPSKRVTDYFLDTYLAAVHWFMMVFHEPTLRRSYEALMSSRRCPRSRSNHATFVLLLLSLGAHYAPEEDVRQKFPSFSLDTFRRLSLKRVEDSLHALYDAAELEAVQVCVLLGSYYMYHGRPNLAFTVYKAGLGCAELMSLHREPAWRWLPEMVKEERRRTFWALFVYDRFAATIYGRPCGIRLEEIDVKIPENMGDTTIQHPAFLSTATMPDGTIEPVTTFSYMKFKFKFYQISSPIIGDLYFHRDSSVSALAAKVSRIHTDLVNWFDSLPPELKLDTLFRDPNAPVTPKTRPFMLQALALQVAYDNVQILLHRPLLSQDLRNFKSGQAAFDSSTSAARPSLDRVDSFIDTQQSAQDVHQILISSRDSCWESAMRSSRLGRFQQCLAFARDSHAAAFLGINLFTAGMVLCVVALSRPLSSQAHLAKQGVSRIMALSRFLSGKALLSAQTTKILKDLIRLIGEKEIKAMLSESGGQESTSFFNSDVGRPTTMRSLTETPAPTNEPKGYAEHNATQHTLGLGNTADSLAGAFQQDSIFAESFDFSGFENLDLNNGIATLQQAMFPASRVATPDLDKMINDGTRREQWNRDQYNAEHAYINQNGGSEDGLIGTDFNMMNTVGQTWLWDNPLW